MNKNSLKKTLVLLSFLFIRESSASYEGNVSPSSVKSYTQQERAFERTPRTNDEWPTFDKEQLKQLASGEGAYWKNPVTGRGELFFIDKKADPAVVKEFKDNMADIEDGDLTPEDEAAYPNPVINNYFYKGEEKRVKIRAKLDTGFDPDDQPGDYTKSQFEQDKEGVDRTAGPKIEEPVMHPEKNPDTPDVDDQNAQQQQNTDQLYQ